MRLMMEEIYDVLIVGAGPSGLCAARTFIQCEPEIKIGLVDSHADLGGVWAKENLYAGLKTNNLRGTLDFTDMPMDDTFGVRAGEHVAGKIMHNYLVAYAQRWSLLHCIKFSTTVLAIQREDDGVKWSVRTQSSNPDKPGTLMESTIRTKKIITATGVTNKPHIPGLLGEKDFDGPIIHSAALGREEGRLTKDPSIRTVAVLGGGKSAYDAVYLAASAGKEVEWIMRKSGKGPAWVFPSHAGLGPFKAWREKLVTRRVISFLSPCIWGAVDGFGWARDFLHHTWLGKHISQGFWSHIHHVTLEDCGYRKHQKLNVLEPEQSPFWYGTASGVYSYSNDFYSFIRDGQVRLHREDISHLSSHAIHLASSQTLQVDALITATGFTIRPTVKFQPSTLAADLGVPTPITSLTPAQSSLWTNLNYTADSQISSTYPRLTSGPFRSPTSDVVQPYNNPSTPNSDIHYTPYRLYRSIAPALLATQGDNSIAFIGYISNIAATVRLEITCLWAYAYLSGRLDLPRPDQPSTALEDHPIFRETALMQRFCHFRAPYGHGRWYPDLNFDQLPFFDFLMKDLGLKTRRKKGWFKVLRELFEPYAQEDYRGLVEEWLGLQSKKDALEKLK